MALGGVVRDFVDGGRSNNGTGGHYLEKSGDDLPGMHRDRVKL